MRPPRVPKGASYHPRATAWIRLRSDGTAPRGSVRTCADPRTTCKQWLWRGDNSPPIPPVFLYTSKGDTKQSPPLFRFSYGCIWHTLSLYMELVWCFCKADYLIMLAPFSLSSVLPLFDGSNWFMIDQLHTVRSLRWGSISTFSLFIWNLLKLYLASINRCKVFCFLLKQKVTFLGDNTFRCILPCYSNECLKFPINLCNQYIWCQIDGEGNVSPHRIQSQQVIVCIVIPVLPKWVLQYCLLTTGHLQSRFLSQKSVICTAEVSGYLAL